MKERGRPGAYLSCELVRWTNVEVGVVHITKSHYWSLDRTPDVHKIEITWLTIGKLSLRFIVCSRPLTLAHLASVSCGKCSQAFPIFLISSTSMYWTPTKEQKMQRPGNEATNRGIHSLVHLHMSIGHGNIHFFPWMCERMPGNKAKLVLGLNLAVHSWFTNMARWRSVIQTVTFFNYRLSNHWFH